VAADASSLPRAQAVAFFSAVVLVGLNLRTVFASLPPLLDDVRDDLGLSASVAGLLTAGPVVCFGALAPAVPPLVRRVAIEQVVAVCAALTAVGAAVRGIDGTAGLFAGTMIAGAAVAIAQTSLPTLLRTRFPHASGTLTGAFSMALTLGAAVAAGTAVPLERSLGGWRAALAVFAVPAALAAAGWALADRESRTMIERTQPLRLRRLQGSWSLAAFFGLQSMAFYAGLSWLPTILESHGYSEGAAGALLALASALQFGPAFLVPVLAARRDDQTGLLAAVVAVAVAALVGLLVAPGAAAVWMGLLGLAQGGALGLALILPVLRGADAQAVAALTAMTLSVGYLLASLGPAALGVAHDVSGGWTVPVVVLIAITATEFFAGLSATRAWTVGAATADAEADKFI
jgi:CP family cyanate transporter-like MFS transporter